MLLIRLSYTRVLCVCLIRVYYTPVASYMYVKYWAKLSLICHSYTHILYLVASYINYVYYLPPHYVLYTYTLSTYNSSYYLPCCTALTHSLSLLYGQQDAPLQAAVRQSERSRRKKKVTSVSCDRFYTRARCSLFLISFYILFFFNLIWFYLIIFLCKCLN